MPSFLSGSSNPMHQDLSYLIHSIHFHFTLDHIPPRKTRNSIPFCHPTPYHNVTHGHIPNIEKLHTILYHIISDYIIPYNTISHHTVYHTILYYIYIKPYHIILYTYIPYYTTSEYNTILYHIRI